MRPAIRSRGGVRSCSGIGPFGCWREGAPLGGGSLPCPPPHLQPQLPSFPFLLPACPPAAPAAQPLFCDARPRRFNNNPLVLGAPYIRYYAGRALVCKGHKIGTFCIIDRTPRSALDAAQRDELIMCVGPSLQHRRGALAR